MRNLKNASLLVAYELDCRLADWEHSAAVPPGAAFLAFNNQGVVRRSGAPIAFFPEIARPPELSLKIFAGAEPEEY